jgi:MipA family protein
VNEQQIEVMAVNPTIRWLCLAAGVTAPFYATPAFAHDNGETSQNSVSALSDQQLPDVGFAKARRCAQRITPLAGGLGRLGGFDLTKLGAPLEASSFENTACTTSTGSSQHRDPGAGSRQLADDGGMTNVQFVTPGVVAPSLDSQPAASKNVFEGTFALVGISVGSIPTYEGSRRSQILPVPGALGRVGGVDFRIAGPSLTLDFIKGKPDAKVGWALGPSVRYRFNRSGKTGDPVVDQLGKLKGVIEFGVNAGVTVKRVLTKYDLLSVGVSARWDVTGRGSGLMVSPSVSYLMPVSKAQVVGALVSADFVDTRYAKYNYSVTPAGSAASGLPTFVAKGGFKAATVGVFTARDLSGNILDGGFAIGVGAMYTKLNGSAAKTPITALRGKRNQWIFGGGLIYTF